MQKFIDTHHHLWELSTKQLSYAWLDKQIVKDFFLGDYCQIRRDFLPEDYLKQIPNGYELIASVHCEAECERQFAYQEAVWIAKQNEQFHNVANLQVVWVDLLNDNLGAELAKLIQIGNVVGVRYKPITAQNASLINTLPVKGSLQDERLKRGLEQLMAFGLHWDLRVPSWHLQQAAQLLSDLPLLKVVINHTGLPWQRDAEGLACWKSGLMSLMSLPNVWLKLSELGCPNLAYNKASNQRLLNTAFEVFDTKRLMFASNAPVSGLQVSYLDWLEMVITAAKHYANQYGYHSQSIIDEILWKNALRCYPFGLAH